MAGCFDKSVTVIAALLLTNQPKAFSNDLIPSNPTTKNVPNKAAFSVVTRYPKTIRTPSLSILPIDSAIIAKAGGRLKPGGIGSASSRAKSKMTAPLNLTNPGCFAKNLNLGFITFSVRNRIFLRSSKIFTIKPVDI
jgi:hypothetical protein